MLALGADAPGSYKVDGELSAFSMGSTYSEEGEGKSYIPGMMYHDEDGEPLLDQQPFAFGDYLSAEAHWLANSTVSPANPTCLLIWLHPFSYNTGYSPQYGQADVRAPVAREAGCVVMAFDQVGFGIRVTQGGNKFYARHGGSASLLGQMVKDVRAAVDFMLCRSPALRHDDVLCSQHGYSVDNSPIDRIPYIDPARIYVAGFALGGTVALHAAALDSRIKAVASFAGFTPFRTDTSDKPTGGIRRLYEMHALLPRLGLFDNGETHNNVMTSIPYDYDELLSEGIAPRPTLLYTPQSDRDATWSDVSACVNDSKSAWPGE
jgi:pimeloyl-ACP methyl ester carboxylesterase